MQPNVKGASDFVSLAGRLLSWMLSITVLLGIGSRVGAAPESSAALRSWRDTPARAALLSRLELLLDTKKKDFVPLEQRVAVFDADGTMWCERPMPLLAYAGLDRLAANSSGGARVLERYSGTAADTLQGMLEVEAHRAVAEDLLAAAFSGMSTSEYRSWVAEWLARWQHGRWGISGQRLVYQPMRELVLYLRDKGFRVFILSTGDVEFARVLAGDALGSSAYYVQGSQVELRREMKGDVVVFRRGGRMAEVCYGLDRVALVEKVIGVPPVIVVGNSNLDVPLMAYVKARRGGCINVFIKHTDAAREYAYADYTGDALPQDTIVVDMKNDWAEIFPSE
jgi:phosphoserine phosphatase